MFTKTGTRNLLPETNLFAFCLGFSSNSEFVLPVLDKSCPIVTTTGQVIRIQFCLVEYMQGIPVCNHPLFGRKRHFHLTVKSGAHMPLILLFTAADAFMYTFF